MAYLERAHPRLSFAFTLALLLSCMKYHAVIGLLCAASVACCTGLAAPTTRSLHAIHHAKDETATPHSVKRSTSRMMNATIVKEESPSLGSNSLSSHLKILTSIAVWYLGNIYYTIHNKKACNMLLEMTRGTSNLHWTLSASQLVVGLLFISLQWLLRLRPFPRLSLNQYLTLLPIGLFSSLAHSLSVLAQSSGAVSFAQIVKSAEPAFAAITSILLTRSVDHPLVYAALVPVIGGVILASLKETSFTWIALISASLANQAAALRTVVSKNIIKAPWAKTLGPITMFAVINMLSLLCLLPWVFALDGPLLLSILPKVAATGISSLYPLLQSIFLSGLSFYIYNEASFVALSQLAPVTHSVVNTLKRVIIILVSCAVFQTPMTMLGGIGSAVAVLGTLLYSLAKQKLGGVSTPPDKIDMLGEASIVHDVPLS